jgi:hypothetical protein
MTSAVESKAFNVARLVAKGHLAIQASFQSEANNK